MKKEFFANVTEIELRESTNGTEIWIRITWKFENQSLHYQWIKL